MQPVHDVVSQLVYSATGAEVSTVVCAGQLLMENRQVKTLDSERIYSEVQEILSRIKSSLA
jgi:5-methylthioadenosine/S-adenosylhomocysteine deaminase